MPELSIEIIPVLINKLIKIIIGIGLRELAFKNFPLNITKLGIKSAEETTKIINFGALNGSFIFELKYRTIIDVENKRIDIFEKAKFDFLEMFCFLAIALSY